MLPARRKLPALLVGLLLLGSFPAGAAEPYLYDIQPGVTVVGWDRLSTDAQEKLRRILIAYPRALTPWLRAITVDNAPIPEPLASETCVPNGEWLSSRPCGFNTWASTAGGENPFPPDAPESVWVNGFVAVVGHEYGHQVAHGTANEQVWVDGLIAEAGDEPMHYLRSMVPAGYFRQYPQEFMASMWNQWGACSRCTLKLALARWDQGNPHPLNQVVLLMALSGFRHGFLNDNDTGTVLAHRMQGDVPVPEFWSVRPWQCGVTLAFTGPDWSLAITTDAECRVLTVGERMGL